MKSFSLFIVLSLILLHSSCIPSNTEKSKNIKTLNKVSLLYFKTKPDKKISCTLLINDTILYHGKVKQRGGSSMGYAKKSYTVKLHQKAEILGIKESKKWILNACFIDKTFLRNKLLYDLYRDLSIENIAPRIELIRFYHDLRYEGIYQLTQKIDQFSLNVSTDGGMIFKDPPLFNSERITPQESDSYYQQNFPSIKVKDYNLYMDSLYELIHNSSDKNFKEKIPKLFDLKSILDWQILIMLSNNGDGVLKNFYLYKKNHSDKFKIVIWDYDATLGRDGDTELNMMKTTSHWERNSLINRLYKLNASGYRDKLTQRWNQLRKDNIISSEKLKTAILEMKRQIIMEVPHNTDRWPLDSEPFQDGNDFEAELEVIYKFLDIRIPQLDKKFSN